MVVMLTVGVVSCTRLHTCSGVEWSSSTTASRTSCRCGVIRMRRSSSVERSAARSWRVVSTGPIYGVLALSIPMAMRVLAFLDGTLADPDAPHIRVDDLGLMRGDGIFETILVVDGRPREQGH